MAVPTQNCCIAHCQQCRRHQYQCRDGDRRRQGRQHGFAVQVGGNAIRQDEQQQRQHNDRLQKTTESDGVHQRFNRDLIGAPKLLQDEGYIEITTSAATQITSASGAHGELQSTTMDTPAARA